MTESSPTDPKPERAPEVVARAEHIWRRRALRFALWTTVILAVLITGLYLFLRTETGRNTARGVVVTQIQNLLAEDATVSADRLDGNFLTGARLTGVRIERRGEPVLTADSLLIDYNLRTLLSRTFSASHLLIATPNVYIRQYADSTYNVTGLLAPNPDKDTTKAGFDVTIEQAVVTNGRAEIHFYTGRSPGDRDSVLVVRNIGTKLSGLIVTKEQLEADIEKLAFTGVATDGETELSVATSGAFSKEAIDLRELTVNGTGGTRLDGDARLVFEREALPVFDADLEAAPLALADVRAFAPVAVYGDPRIRLNANSDGRQLRFGLRASLPDPDGGDAAIVLDGALSRRGQDGPLAYRAEGTLRRLDPSVLTRNPALAADINGDLTVDLEGTTLRTLSGPFSIDLDETRVAGRTINRLDLNGRITDGLLRFDLDGALPGLDLVAEGEARPFERVPTVNLRGTARDLNLAALVPGQAGRFAGDFAIEGRGNSVETFYGSAAVSLSRAEIALGDRMLNLTRAEFDADLRGGDIAFDTDLVFGGGGGALAASGSTRLGTETPVYTVDRGVMRGLDLAILSGNPDLSSSLTGTFSVDGRGADPRTLAADVDLALSPSRYGTYTVQSARLDGALRGGRATFDVAADLGRAGALTAIGTAQPFSDPLSYDARGSVRDLDIAVLTQDPAQTSDLTGTYSVTGRGIDPKTMTANVDLTLSPSTFGEYAVQSARLDGSLRGGRLGFDLAADLGRSGALTAVGTANPFVDPLTYDARGSVTNLDLAALTKNPDQFSDLTGSYAINGRGIDPETLTADATVLLAPSSYGLREIGSANVTVNLDRGAFAVRGDLDIREGQFSVNASGNLGDELALDLGDGTCFRGVDVGELTRNAKLVTDLNGCFTGTLRGLDDPETLTASGVLDLSGSQINDALITDGTIRFTLADGDLNARGQIETEGGDVLDPNAVDPELTPDGALTFALSGRPLDDEPSYTLDAQTRGLNVSALAGLDAPEPIVLTVDLDVTGRGFDPATADIRGRIRSAPTRAAGFAVDTLSSGFALRAGVLDVDSLLLRTDLIDATADGQIAVFDADAPTDFAFQADVVSLAPLGRFTEEPLGLQTGAVNMRVTGAGGAAPLLAVGTLQARQFVYGDIAVTGVDGALSATVDRAAIDTLGLAAVQGTLSSRFDVLSRGTLTVQEGTVDARLNDGVFAFDTGVTLDGTRDLDFSARLDFDNGTGIIVEDGRFALDGNEWVLTDEARIAFDEGLITIETLRIMGDGPGELITVNGVLDLEGEQNLRASIAGLDIGGLTDLAGLEGLGGRLGIELKMVGTLDSLVLDSRVTLDQLASRGEVFGDLEADIDFAERRIGVDAVLRHVNGQALTAAGVIPLAAFTPIEPSAVQATGGPSCSAQLSGSPVADGLDFRADADAFPIDWARPFLNERKFNALDGSLDLALLVRGTGTAPCFGGRAALANGRFGVVATGLVYEPINASVQLEGDVLNVERLTIGPEVNPGVVIEGDITFPQLTLGTLDLTITPRDFLAMDTYALSGIRLGAGRRPLRFTGTLAEPVLQGDVALASGDIYVTDRMGLDLDPVTLDQADFDAIQAEYGTKVTAADTTESRFLKALRYDLAVTIDRDVWLRSANSNLGFDIEFEGEVQAQKAPYPAKSQLFGQIDLVRGNVSTLNRRFDVNRGVLIFNGDPLTTNVDLQATTDIRLSSSVAGQSAVEITLLATGQVGNDPEIRLSSDPPLSSGDIASLLVTGQLASNAVSTDGALGVAGGALLGSVSGAAEGLVGGIGFDLVEIDVDATGTLVLRLGKYLTSRAFASVAVPVNQDDARTQRQGSGTQLTLEYQLKRWLMLQGEAGGTRGSGAGITAETSF